MPNWSETDLMRVNAQSSIDPTHAGIRQRVLDRQLARAWVGMVDDPEWSNPGQYDSGRDPTVPRGSVWSYYEAGGGRDVERANAVDGEIGDCRPEGWLPIPERP